MKMYELKDAVVIVLAEKKNRWIFGIASTIIFALLYMVPVWSTPGNTIGFHFSILPKWVFVLMIFLAILNGLLIAMQSHIHDVTKKRSAAQTAKESATAVGIISSALVSTLACAACYSSILSLFGLGATTFVVKYQAHIAIFALALTLFALYYTSKRVENKCQVCTI